MRRVTFLTINGPFSPKDRNIALMPSDLHVLTTCPEMKVTYATVFDRVVLGGHGKKSNIGMSTFCPLSPTVYHY